MQQVYDALQSNAGLLAAIALILGILALIIGWVGLRRVRAIPPPPPPSAGFVDDPALDRILSAQMQRLDGLANDISGLTTRTRVAESQARHAVQHVGLVRFNPFEDTGSNQSFALALLDADANGVILSSLHSRQATRVYLKSITGGRCEAPLSTEESEALKRAQEYSVPA